MTGDSQRNKSRWPIALTALAASACAQTAVGTPAPLKDSSRSTTVAQPSSVPTTDTYAIDLRRRSSFSPGETLAMTAAWGQCSSRIYDEMLRIRQAEANSAAYNATNCAIFEAIHEARQHRNQLQWAVDAKRWQDAFRHFAAVLYISQAFYANSNFVELAAQTVDKIQDAQLFKVWDDAQASALVASMPQLVSGTDIGARPKRCRPGVAGRRELSKARGGGACSDILLKWNRWTKHSAATYLSAKAGEAWARDVSTLYPSLLSDCESLTLVAMFEESDRSAAAQVASCQ